MVVLTGDMATATALRQHLPASLVVLGAQPATLADRITRRALGEGPPISGDLRRGLAGPELAAATTAAEAEASALRAPPGAPLLPTDGADPDHLAASALALAGVAPQSGNTPNSSRSWPTFR
ncbi:hypothetical protein OG897_34105 [Streptomyces sp. NBC_00237]|uniref:hypothetical protein n=1 Tax=Streptomyces sp. NBC_00237 TaxID=2975687 RepID=UPI00225764CC|nr:hypothetical protein [Streptomyces sp. NBC_00237]MCX5206429.1 hypothetical protein [Streptomyces sp. NBC_00237]